MVAVGKAGQRERETGVFAVGVVHEDGVLTDVGHFDDAQLPIAAHRDSTMPVDAEPNRLPVVQVNHHLFTRVTAGDVVEGTVVEHVAVLKDLDKRCTPMRVCSAEHFDHVLSVEVVRASDERRLRSQRHRQRVERMIDGAKRCALGDLARLRRRRILTLGEAVDAIVEQQDRQVHVAAQCVDEVVAANGQRVAVAGDHPHVEVRPGHRDACGNGRSTAMNAVHAIRIHVVRETAAAPDTTDEHSVLRSNSQLGHQRLHGVHHAIVAATGAPANLLVADPVLL